MDPYGTFGGGKGIPSPPPKPKGSVSQIPQAIPTMDPSYNKFTGLQPIQQNSSRVSGFQSPTQGNISQAIDTYDSITGPAPPPSGGPAYVFEGADQNPDQSQDSWRNRLYAERASNQRSGGYVGGGGGSPSDPANRGKLEAIPAPEMPTFQGEEYKPPEEDEGIYDTEREKAIRPGLRALREGTSEAISTAQSLDNPNARAMFIKKALHGYGQGLEGVASQADKQATGVSERKHARELQKYQTKFDYKRSTDLVNYQSKINQIAADYANQQQVQQANWEAGQGGSTQTQSGTGITYENIYGSRQNEPNLGYFAM